MHFEHEALVTELQLIRALAEPFLEPESFWDLQQAISRLRGLPVGDTSASWSIDEPIFTIPSRGEYARGGRGELVVRANVSTLWEITRIDRKTVAVRDNVSTSVLITTEDEETDVSTEIARWTMDIAAVESAPGCGLHAQVKESEAWFPKALDVPRLPVFIPTLGAVLEFVLGELFQDTWPKHVSGHTSAHSWRALQTRSWNRWLSWQQQIVGAGSVSPWLDLKAHRCAKLNDH